jgi:hypothetical protein
MLTNLKRWAEALIGDADEDALEAAVHERRFDRYDLTGKSVALRLGPAPFTLHLKDVSCSGACGLTDAPVRPGQVVRIDLNRDVRPVAEVRWVRKTFIGVAFEEPLSSAFLSRYHAGFRGGRGNRRY